jgi:trigger factor
MDGEPFQDPVTDAVFILGETNLLSQLREKLEEMKPGETASFDIAFDEDDDTADPSIRGNTLSYSVTLKEIKERELVELNDEFAQAVNEAATMDELRQQIREDLHMGKSQDGRNKVVNQIINQMAEQAEIDPPAVMVDEEVEHQINHLKEDLQRSNTPWEGYLRMQGQTEDGVKEQLRPEAERRLRNSLFLQEVARRESVEVTPDEIDAEISRLAGPAPDEGDEAAAAQAARMAQFYQSDYFRQMLRNELFERKLTERLVEIATDGSGAVLNAYVAPEPVAAGPGAASEAEPAAATGTDADETPAATAEDVVPDGEDASEIEQLDLGGQVPAPQTMAATADAAPAAETEARDDPTAGSEDVPFAGAVAGDGTVEAPEGYPIKGNANSMIYHVPGGGSYDQTIAEYYFESEEAAEAAGFRAAKR